MSVATKTLSLATVALLGVSLAACSEKADDANAVAVSATDTACTPDQTKLESGVKTFNVKNEGSKSTELYILRPNGSTIGERENIGPGTTVNLTVELPAGEYFVRCRPGDIGDGIRTSISVSGSKVATQADTRIKAAVDGYRTYVAAQSADSLALTKELQAAIRAGDVKKAKQLYPASRVGWESIEPVAEAFGDLDPAMDLREADLEDGQKWTGWHVIEKQLWTKNSTRGLNPVADDLITNLNLLISRVPKAEITGTSMANGAKELLDEVATGKITGEEEAFSHTDLIDFQANLDGAKKAYDLLQPVVAESQPDLSTQLDAAFKALQGELDTIRTGDKTTDYPSYSTIDKAEREELSAKVDALSEPLSHLAASVTV